MHATLCDLITDLVQNAFEAEATEIYLKMEETARSLKVEIDDNGKGMNADTLAKARDPFFTDGCKHRHRKVGLGLPFLFQTAEMTGGTADIQSTVGAGTKVTFRLDRSHVDLPAFGDWATAAVTLLTYGGSVNLKIRRRLNRRCYVLDKQELEGVLGCLNDVGNLMLLKEFIEGQEADIQSG